jgi:myo-inositol-1(or 4)-monophosphatase
MYTAARGEGAWAGSTRTTALATPLSESSMIMFTSNLLTGGKCPSWATVYLAQTNWKMRILGSAALEATYVAAGVAHGAITVNGKLWDVAAAAALVLEAGGVMTDLKGKPIFPFDLAHYGGAKIPFLAAAPQAHQQLLNVILKNP